ncbi:MAG: hypothetical protein ACJAW3_001598 [Lentimonas sp.]|jgi:hypothetical protein
MLIKNFTLSILFLSLFLTGCTKSKQARKVEKSGFIGDYSLLTKGKDDQALFTYRKSEFGAKKYNKIIIDPAKIWTGKDSKLSKLEPKTRQEIADNFNNYLVAEISKIMTVTKNPGLNTIRFQAAITDVDFSNPTLDIISSILPYGLAISLAKEVATGKPSSVGESSIEIKVSDSMSGEIIAAAVDKRVGSKRLDIDIFDKKADVDEILKYWAKFIAYKICMSKELNKCIDPKA